MKTIPYVELKKSESKFQKKIITDSKSCYNYIKQFYQDDLEIYESVFILMLNTQNETIGFAKISQGGINATIIDVKIIAKFAVEHLATNIVMAHNHPSGTLMPSQADINITNKVKNAMLLLDIRLIDHIILTADNYYSFLDDNKI